jgi:hypothetical protein
MRRGTRGLAGVRQRLSCSLESQDKHAERAQDLLASSKLRAGGRRAVRAVTELLAQESGERSQLRHRGVE